MKGTILLNHNENFRIVEDEEKQRFLRDLLSQMGVPISDFWNDETSLTVDQKIKLRSVLTTFRVQVIDDMDGHMQVYFTDDNGETELVGEWFKCSYKLKKDPSQKDPKRQLYLEMEVSCWSVYEEQETSE